MKKNVFLIPISIAVISLSGCDRVEYAKPVFPGVVDWSLCPYDKEDYNNPIWQENTNTLKNVMLEDYTGHRCPNCPSAGEIALEIEQDNPDRVFVSTIHASTDGYFQLVVPPEFVLDFTTTEGDGYANDLFGFQGNPMGTINRVLGGYQNSVWYISNGWEQKCEEVMQSDLDVNLQLQYNYFPSTNGLFIHVETDFLNDMEGDYNLVVSVLREEIIAPQETLTGIDHHFHHHSVFSGNVNGTWGTRIVSGSVNANADNIETMYTYEVPSDPTFDIENLTLLTYVTDANTQEVLQVIKTELQE